MEKRLQCDSETGVTVGLIDALISIAHALVERDRSAPEVDEALKDLRACDDMHRLMDIGDLVSAKAYIREQDETIKTLVGCLEIANKLARGDGRNNK